MSRKALKRHRDARRAPAEVLTARGRVAWLLLLPLAGLLAPPAVAGQTTEELVQRLDSLHPLLEEARREAKRAELEARLRAQAELGITLDTLQVGPLRVVTPTEQADHARRAFEEAWEAIAPSVGDATHVLEDKIWVFQYAPRLHPIRLPSTPRRADVHHVRVRSWRSWDRVVGSVEGSVWRRLASAVPGEAGSMIGRWRWPTDEILEMAYRDLVTAPGRPSRACARGDIEACWTAMGADGVPERWDAWYGPAERRRAVLARPPPESVHRTRYQACERGSQAACDLFLEEWKAPEIPMRGMARTGLARYAVELGGEGSYRRLLEAGDVDLREAVSRAADLDADEVMRRWRALMLEHRPEIGTDVARSWWSTLFWIVALGTVAMGSTRWRLD